MLVLLDFLVLQLLWITYALAFHIMIVITFLIYWLIVEFLILAQRTLVILTTATVIILIMAMSCVPLVRMVSMASTVMVMAVISAAVAVAPALWDYVALTFLLLLPELISLALGAIWVARTRARSAHRAPTTRGFVILFI